MVVTVDRKSLKDWKNPRYIVINKQNVPIHNLRLYNGERKEFLTYCGLEIDESRVESKYFVFPSKVAIKNTRVCRNCKRVNLK